MSSNGRATLHAVNVIGGTLVHEGENELLRTRACTSRSDATTSSRSPNRSTAARPIADYVDANHHGLFAVWLQVEDLAGVIGFPSRRSQISAAPLEDGAQLPLRSRHHQGRALGRHHRVDPERLPPVLVTSDRG